MKVQTLGALVPLILWAGLRMFALAVVSRYIVAHGESDTGYIAIALDIR